MTQPLATPKPRRSMVAFVAAVVALAVAVVGVAAVLSHRRVSSTDRPPIGPDANLHQPLTLDDTAYPIPRKATFVAPTGNDHNPGTLARPKRTIAQALRDLPAGGTVVVRGGTYREALGNVFRKFTLQPYPHEAVWIKGSDVVSGWQHDGSVWRHDNWQATFCHTCAPEAAVSKAYPLASAPDQVFFNGEPVRQVTDRRSVTRGTFSVDYKRHVLYVGDDPTDALVEASVRWKALQVTTSRASGSIIRGIGFAQYAPHWNVDQPAAVIINASDVTLESDTFGHSAGTSLAITQPRVTLRRSHIVSNGYRGIVVDRANGVRVTDNVISGNNTEHFDTTSCGNYCTVAGVKITHTASAYVADNDITDNAGNGVWCDLGCTDATIVRNSVRRNIGNGIYYEVSSRAVIASNLIVDNVIGIKISGSDQVRVFNNTFVANHIHLGVYDDRRDSSSDPYAGRLGLSWDTTETQIVNNILANNDTTESPFVDTNASDHVDAAAEFSVLKNNIYYRTNGNPPTLYRWCLHSGCTDFPSPTALHDATGLEADSLDLTNQPDPLFVNAIDDDYRLSATSPALAMGSALPTDIANAIGVAPSPVNVGALRWPHRDAPSDDGDSGETPGLAESSAAPSASSAAGAARIALTAPAAGAVVSGTVELAAQASSPMHVAKVTFYADGYLIGEDDTAPYSVSWTPQAPRSHPTVQLYAVLTDTASNTTRSASVQVQVSHS